MKWHGVTAKMKLRGKRPPHYGVKGNGSTWRGPVERRDPRHYQRQADCGIKRCGNRFCALWLSSTVTRCPHCYERQKVVS